MVKASVVAAIGAAVIGLSLGGAVPAGAEDLHGAEHEHGQRADGVDGDEGREVRHTSKIVALSLVAPSR